LDENLFLFGNDNIHYEAHCCEQYSIFLNAKFVASLNISPLNGAKTVFGQGGGQIQKT